MHVCDLEQDLWQMCNLEQDFEQDLCQMCDLEQSLCQMCYLQQDLEQNLFQMLPPIFNAENWRIPAFFHLFSFRELKKLKQMEEMKQKPVKRLAVGTENY